MKAKEALEAAKIDVYNAKIDFVNAKREFMAEAKERSKKVIAKLTTK